MGSEDLKDTPYSFQIDRIIPWSHHCQDMTDSLHALSKDGKKVRLEYPRLVSSRNHTMLVYAKTADPYVRPFWIKLVFFTIVAKGI